ncbi:MAG: RND transporter [Bacteroidia bacterium]|nr:MAG: RND transporter [Bacteroidia bacterium]
MSFGWKAVGVTLGISVLGGCAGFRPARPMPQLHLPPTYAYHPPDSTSIGTLPWRQYFKDPYLQALIDTALAYNQELRILEAEVEIARREAQARRGEYLPFVRLGLQSEVAKSGAFTPAGAVERQLAPEPGRPFPEPLSLYEGGLYASWELDIWRRLRNARQAALLRVLAAEETRRFATTQLVAEVAESYYELLALRALVTVIDTYIQIQTQALQLTQLNKQAGRATQLAVNRFQARLLNTQNRRYLLVQRQAAVENRLTFLLGRIPARLPLSSEAFLTLPVDTTMTIGTPSQLLTQRPDVRAAEKTLQAAHLEVLSARAAFYPVVGLRGALGVQAFHPGLLLSPESMLYSLGWEALQPLINWNALKAAYGTATARQRQALQAYERTLLTAYTEVQTQWARLLNATRSYATKAQEVAILLESIPIANRLYRSAEADYLEVLLTQTEALEAQMELIETKLEALRAQIALYRALGGGWQ